MADRVQEILNNYCSDKNVFEEARAIRDGGGYGGSIIGRNSFQRPKAEAIKFLQTIMGIYAGEIQ